MYWLTLKKVQAAVQAIFAFVSSWNNYFIPALVLDTADKKTLPILPVIIVYLLLSKFIVRGVALGGVKG